MSSRTTKDFLSHTGSFSLNEKETLRKVIDNIYTDYIAADAAVSGAAPTEAAMTAGTGITGGVGTVYKASVVRGDALAVTTIFVDLTGLNSSAAGDIIGKNATANCHLGQITAAVNGTIVGGTITCLETPATGIDDFDLFSATVGTGTEDTAISALTETSLYERGAAWAAGDVKPLAALPAANEYLYLVGSGAGADATYTAGIIVITLYGTV